jgi:hypothetical protein
MADAGSPTGNTGAGAICIVCLWCYFSNSFCVLSRPPLFIWFFVSRSSHFTAANGATRCERYHGQLQNTMAASLNWLRLASSAGAKTRTAFRHILSSNETRTAFMLRQIFITCLHILERSPRAGEATFFHTDSRDRRRVEGYTAPP